MGKNYVSQKKTSKLTASKEESKNDNFSSDSDIEENFVTPNKKDIVKKSVKKYLKPSQNEPSKNKPTVNKNTTPIESFLKHNSIEDYDKIPVVYLAAVGLIEDDWLFKYGYTSDIIKRLTQHKTTFGDQFKLILIAQTDNNVAVEKKYKELIKEHGFNFEMEFGNSMQTELIRTHGEFTIDNAKGLLECLAENYISDSMQDMMDKYNNNKYVIKADMMVKIEKEKTEQYKEERLKEEAIARQKEADAKTADANARKEEAIVKQKEIEYQKEEDRLKENKIEQKSKVIEKKEENIIKDFLNECVKKTENRRDKILCTVLYEKFISWFRNKSFNFVLPTYNFFKKELKNHTFVKQKVRDELKVQAGIEGYLIL
jgi:hypothetical protein